MCVESRLTTWGCSGYLARPTMDLSWVTSCSHVTIQPTHISNPPFSPGSTKQMGNFKTCNLARAATVSTGTTVSFNPSSFRLLTACLYVHKKIELTKMFEANQTASPRLSVRGEKKRENESLVEQIIYSEKNLQSRTEIQRRDSMQGLARYMGMFRKCVHTATWIFSCVWVCWCSVKGSSVTR